MNCSLGNMRSTTTFLKALVFLIKQSSGVPITMHLTPKNKCCTSKCRWQTSFVRTVCAVISWPTSTHCVGKSQYFLPSSTLLHTGSPFGTLNVRSSPVVLAASTVKNSATCYRCCAKPIAAPSVLSTCTFKTLKSSVGCRLVWKGSPSSRRCRRKTASWSVSTLQKHSKSFSPQST